MYINFSSNLFLEKAELQRFKESLDDNGFRKFIINNSLSFGLVKNTNDSTFSNGLIQIISDSTVRIESILAVDNKGLIIDREGIDIEVPNDNLWYWVKIEHQYSSLEEGTVEIDANGNLTGTGTKFRDILRGQPNFPSKIRFVDSLYNNLEYEILEVIDDENLVLNIMEGTLYPEVDLLYKVVGTFTPGYAPSVSEKYPFQHDHCLITLQQSVARPDIEIGEEGKIFYIGRVKRQGSTIVVEDGRIDIWKLKSDYQLTNLTQTINPLFGVENIKFDSQTTARDKKSCLCELVI